MEVDRTADEGIIGPPVGRPLGHLVVERPRRDGLALRDREGELGFQSVPDFSGHGTDWHAIVIFDRASSLPQLAVLSLGPRLAGTPARGKKALEAATGYWLC